MATSIVTPLELVIADELASFDKQAYIAAEGERLRDMRETMGNDAVAARARVLLAHGWQANTVASAIGVTRQSLVKWLKAAPDAELLDTSPVLDRRTKNQRIRQSGYALKRDRLAVPDALTGPLRALWRIAYTHRFSTAQTQDSRAASDALDVLLSMLLRRGVTYFAIADAAGVTVHAVIDRMHRASAKCRVFCDGEEFIGWTPTLGTTPDEWLQFDGTAMVYALATVSDKAGTAKVRFAVVTENGSPMVVDVKSSSSDLVAMDTKLVPQPAVDLGLARVIEYMPLSEKQFVDHFTGRVAPNGKWTVLVPERLLYQPASATMFQSPELYFPSKLWDEFIAPNPLVLSAMYTPEEIFDEYDAIKKTGRRSRKAA